MGKPVHLTPLEPRRLLASYGVDETFGKSSSVVLPIDLGSVFDADRVGTDRTLLTMLRISSAEPQKLVMVRDDGTLDPAFGQSGIATLPYAVRDVLLTERRGQFVASDADRAKLYWFKPDGTLRRSFGDAGSVVPMYQGQPVSVEAVAFARNGDLLVVGTGAYNDADLAPWVLLRYRPDGTLNPAYGEGGAVLLDQSYYNQEYDHEYGYSIAFIDRYGAGQIVEDITGVVYVAGTHFHFYSGSADDESDLYVTARRVLAEGVVDRRWQTPNIPATRLNYHEFGGSVRLVQTTATGGLRLVCSAKEGVRTVALNKRGQVVRGPFDDAGLQGSAFVLAEGYGVTRFARDGVVDESFGLLGTARVDPSQFSVSVTHSGGAFVFSQRLASSWGDGPVTITRLNGTSPFSEVAPGSASVKRKLLVVRGTPANDLIAVQKKGGIASVSLNGASVGTFHETTWDEIAIDAADGNDRVMLNGLIASVMGGNGNDTLIADAGFAGGFNDFRGQEGDDVLIAAGAGGTFDGGAGDDRIAGNDAAETLLGGAGRDRIDGRGGADLIDGGGGSDVLSGGDELGLQGAIDTADTLRGGRGNDHISAGAGNDLVEAGRGLDLVYGGPGNDVLVGGPDDDTLYGGEGYDTRDLFDDNDDLHEVEGVE